MTETVPPPFVNDFDDELGLLELLDDEECLHFLRVSLKICHPGNFVSGSVLIGSKCLYVREGDGCSVGANNHQETRKRGHRRLRIPYSNIMACHVRYVYVSDLHVWLTFTICWYMDECRDPVKIEKSHIHLFLGVQGHWEVDGDGRVADRWIEDSTRIKIWLQVDRRERRRYQGENLWYRVLETLIQVHQMKDDQMKESEVDRVLKEYYRAVQVSPHSIEVGPTLRLECSIVIPFCESKGLFVVSPEAGCVFRPYCSDSVGIVRVKKESIALVRKRRYIIEDTACEVYYHSQSGDVASMLLVFDGEETVKNVVAALSQMASGRLCDLREAQRLWKTNQWTNFQYLMYVNDIAGRSFKNIFQYPIFPWVLADYSSNTIDLLKPSSYRDFSKPAAALSFQRASNALEMYKALQGSHVEHPWMYGSHYSNAGIVVFFRVRQHPRLMLKLQGGKFDNPNRMFTSIDSSWKSMCSSLANDVKELIPELYHPRAGRRLLSSSQSIEVGSTGSEDILLHDVLLPPWSENLEDFLSTMRLAIESKYVSDHLHLWIDLIFGHKSRGALAEQSMNVFHFMTYDEMYVSLFYRMYSCLSCCCM